ncbi:carbohydrate ABC transporter permease [Ktedonospora formicarum]|uniref:Spermidine/putrescine ABC transporter permease n=1 Tax=Ktedonospora formicarum TaxID=2778364 RepID=A0A8J3MTP2_9CHLR|nr:sugar ABC transporter permease [Ktedonospora formicarum]GHO47350.1 spermidine/putrescine ABC transporter permease [Ktedonospora formicarum]
MQLFIKHTNQPKEIVRRKKLSKLELREERQFYLFILPWIIGFILFGGGPIVASGVISLTNWSLLSNPQWIGFQNYIQLFQDPLFYLTLRNTLYFGIGSVLLTVIVSFALALLLNQKVKGISVFRTVFYLPSVVSGIATALLWINILHPDFGMINFLLGQIGIQGPGWLYSEDWTIPALILMSAWGAGNTMIIYLSGLQSIPSYMYEAASIDGAGHWSKFWHVTFPMMSPVIFFNLVTGFISSLQAFVLILVMTNGGPANASLVYGLYIYRQAFQYFNMGYASALAWILFVLIIAITFIQFALAGRWVYYEGGVRK